mmetsp:Transcript_27984/g.66291  ORF Transcript_27984/g.66291 Transcript_27984/m.66291 type:complete len:359 (+) Transcript_27984:3-1079(+)
MASRLGDILRHKGVRFIGIGWSAFVVENLVLSEHRDLIINEVGKESYIALYSTLSTAACSSILYGWLRHGRGKGPTLFPGRGGKVVRPLLSFGFHSLGLVGVSQLLPPVTSALGEKAGDPEVSESPVAPLPAVPGAPPSSKCPVPLWMRKGRERPKDSYHTAPAAPADDAAPAPAAAAPSGQSGGICPVTHPIAFVQHWWSGESASVESAAAQQAERLRHEEECAAKLAEEKAELLASEPSGVWRVTRHAGLWSIALFGMGSAVATPFAAEAVLFSGPALMALIGGWHQDTRFRKGSGGVLTPEMEAATSHLPFVALLSGRQSWQALASEMQLENAGVAVSLAAVLYLRRMLRLLKHR